MPPKIGSEVKAMAGAVAFGAVTGVIGDTGDCHANASLDHASFEASQDVNVKVEMRVSNQYVEVIASDRLMS